MNRTDILACVERHMRRNLSELPDEAIDPARSMRDYGASSMDMIEVVGAVTRELDVQVPRKRLVGLKTIGELVDVLLAVRAGLGA